MQITVADDNRVIKVAWPSHTIIFQGAPNRNRFIITRNFSDFGRIFGPPNSYIFFNDCPIYVKATFVRKNNTIEKGYVQCSNLETSISKLSAGFIITFFKLLYNLMSVGKQVRFISENSSNETSRKAHTTFCYS